MKMIYVTHIPKRERTRALRDVYAVEPVAPKFNPWSACPITFDRRDHPTSIRHGGSAALVLDPIIDGYHLTRVLMDGGSSLNLIYENTVCKMGIDPSRIKPSNTTFKRSYTRRGGPLYMLINTGSSIRISRQFLKRSDIVPFRSGYHALLGRTAFARFNAVPHYAYLKLKMAGPRGVITINGNTERSLCTEEHTAALATEVQGGLIKPNTSSIIKTRDTGKLV